LRTEGEAETITFLETLGCSVVERVLLLLEQGKAFLEQLGRSQTPETDIGRHATSNHNVTQTSIDSSRAHGTLREASSPKKVEATHQEGIICVGGFSNPLLGGKKQKLNQTRSCLFRD